MTLTYARHHFDELLVRAASGERIVITRRGREVAVVTSSSDPIRFALRDLATSTSSEEEERCEQERDRG